MSIRDYLPWKKHQATNTDEIAYKRMCPPEPIFFAGIYYCIFVGESIGLETEEMQQLVTTLPKGLQNNGPIWIKLYLCYTLSKLIEEKYGQEFSKQSVAALRQIAAYVKLKETVEQLDALSDGFNYWFDIFDTCLHSRDQPDYPPEIKESPNHFIIAIALLKHGPDGPIFLVDEDSAIKSISNALYEALSAKWEQFKLAVEIGAPLEEIK